MFREKSSGAFVADLAKNKKKQVFQTAESRNTVKYSAYTLKNYKNIPQVKKLPKEVLFDMEVVGNVLPFKADNYVVDEVINWNDPLNDPIFILTFPQKNMLKPKHYQIMANALKKGFPDKKIAALASNIRMELNPHPSGQSSHNVPVLHGDIVPGMQHKYNETALFFPKQGQTCHAYCTFCFRWPQFTAMDDLKFATKEVNQVIAYLEIHPEITDLLITGGDPMVMSGKILDHYISALLEADLPNLQTIRIGTKSLAYWPYRYTSDKDSDKILRVFEKVYKSGKQLAIMAHFNHYAELQTDAVIKAIRRINETGAQIRTQSPIFRYINDDSKVWEKMWREQVRLRCIPYYMFVARDTGAQHYFQVTLENALKIFKDAYSKVSGLGRTVRGPVMSADPGKIHYLGAAEINGEKVMALEFIQARNPDWIKRPFFAKYNKNTIWFDGLEPAFGEKEFFFNEALAKIYLKREKAVEKALRKA